MSIWNGKVLVLFPPILLGMAQAWIARFYMNNDGPSFIDIGDAYLRQDWPAAINGLYSPLYSWLLGIAMWVVKPTPYWEFPLVHLVNLLIYLCSFGCFYFFLSSLLHLTRKQNPA